MNAVRSIIRQEPAATATVLTWLAGGICALLGRPEFAPVLVTAGLVMLGIRTQVTPVAKANETALQAARDAATQTASELTAASAGEVGKITDTAKSVINDVLGLVSGLLGKTKR